jgi:hypothetical protein
MTHRPSQVIKTDEEIRTESERTMKKGKGVISKYDEYQLEQREQARLKAQADYDKTLGMGKRR